MQNNLPGKALGEIRKIRIIFSKVNLSVLLHWSTFSSETAQFHSVAQLCSTLCDPMDCSMPGFPVYHPTPTACSNSCPLSRWWHPTISFSVVPFSCPQSFPASGSFQSPFFTSDGQSNGVSASALVRPMNIQDWFPLGWTGGISLKSKGFSRVFPTPQFKTINFSALSFLYSPALTAIHDYCKNHSFDKVDLCQQSNVSAF